VQNL